MFCKTGVLRNFTKFTGKHLWQSLFFKTLAQVFSCDFVKFLRTPLFTEHFRWLLLSIQYLPILSYLRYIDIFAVACLGNNEHKSFNVKILFGESHFFLLKCRVEYCAESVCIPSFSGPYFPAFGLNTERRDTEYLSEFSPNAEKYRPEKLRIRTLFTQRRSFTNFKKRSDFKVH